ncbi:MAG TPA: hypothetical protein VFE58_01340 [Tepidisphaeraceae bacterium]|jgi:hypothetical protein|nr:hypothetical protein [Tepidisphaeraceae bacterium]
MRESIDIHILYASVLVAFFSAPIVIAGVVTGHAILALSIGVIGIEFFILGMIFTRMSDLRRFGHSKKDRWDYFISNQLVVVVVLLLHLLIGMLCLPWFRHHIHN